MNAHSVQQRQEVFNTNSFSARQSGPYGNSLIDWLNNNNKEDVKLDENILFDPNRRSLIHNLFVNKPPNI